MTIGWIGDPRLVKDQAFLIAAVFAIAVLSSFSESAMTITPTSRVASPSGATSILKRGHFAVSLVMHRATLFRLVRKLLRNM
jgi:hypothetical protein